MKLALAVLLLLAACAFAQPTLSDKLKESAEEYKQIAALRAKIAAGELQATPELTAALDAAETKFSGLQVPYLVRLFLRQVFTLSRPISVHRPRSTPPPRRKPQSTRCSRQACRPTRTPPRARSKAPTPCPTLTPPAQSNRPRRPPKRHSRLLRPSRRPRRPPCRRCAMPFAR